MAPAALLAAGIADFVMQVAGIFGTERAAEKDSGVAMYKDTWGYYLVMAMIIKAAGGAAFVAAAAWVAPVAKRTVAAAFLGIGMFFVAIALIYYLSRTEWVSVLEVAGIGVGLFFGRRIVCEHLSDVQSSVP